MKLGIMQPYLFPYIGYFQLIGAVDIFLVYDDVNFIKQGWINRNRILVNNAPHYFTLSLKGASSFKKICEIEVGENREKLIKSLFQYYGKAPFFTSFFPVLEEILKFREMMLGNFVANSIFRISQYLGIKTKMDISSELKIAQHITGPDRVLAICKHYGADTYINAIGGMDLYSRGTFAANNIKLNFIKTDQVEYKQFSEEFVTNLSIIDVLMFNSREIVREYLTRYSLV